MTATRQLVVQEHADGTQHIVSVPVLRWEIYDRPPPEPSPAELRDEIGLLIFGAGIGEPPLVIDGDDGQPRLVWLDDLAREMKPFVDAFGPTIRRGRRARRAAKARKRQKPTVEGQRPKNDRRRLIEVEQKRGRWREIAPSDAADVASESLIIPRRIVNEIRLHAREVDAEMRGCESVGRIVFVDGRAREYRRLRNLHAEHGVPGKMRLHSSWRRVPDETNVIVHAHPRGGLGPSAGDLRWAAKYPYRNPFGTFSVPLGRLGIWRLDGHGGVAEVEWSMVR